MGFNKTDIKYMAESQTPILDMTKSAKIKDEIEAIKSTLEIGQKYGLTIEIILYTLKAIQKEPGLTIKEACNRGIGEWIK